MPIAELMAHPEFQIVGKVRLGKTTTSAKGTSYPEDLDVFNFVDAPQLLKYYGDRAKEMDIMFVSDDILENIPNDFKMYAAGRIGPDGRRTGGKLLCKGPGPTKIQDGDEVIENPGVAEHWSQRDPVTKVVPARPCMGRKCPDYIAKQCKQSMKVIFIVPIYSWQVGFEIDTTSWYSIGSFIGLLSSTKALTGGRLKHIPFKLVREETSIPYWDEKSQSDKVSTHHIMYLRPNDDFFERIGEAAVRNIDLLQKVNFSLKNVIKEIEAGPMEDHWPALPASDAAAVVDITEKKLKAEDVAADAEVQDAFTALEHLTGKKFDTKARLTAIRKKENQPDMKAAVLEELQKKIADLTLRQPEVKPEAKPEPMAKVSGDSIL